MPPRNPHHAALLKEVIRCTEKPYRDKMLDHYLGASRLRYRLRNPDMRKIVKEWLSANRELSAGSISQVITSLVKAPSVTEKMMGGFILDSCTSEQRKFPPSLYEEWLKHLEGWAEVDTFCAGKYSAREVPAQFETWKPIMSSFSRSLNISKRRASLVLLCTPLRYSDDPRLARLALAHALRLSKEKDAMITKAVSWVLRSMVKLHRPALEAFLRKHRAKLPAIAVRETETKLRTGRKTSRRSD